MLWRGVISALAVTMVEFIFGCVVNLLLGWNVWDYAQMPLSFLGQICLTFSLMWFLLSIPVLLISQFLQNSIFRRTA